MHRGRRCQDARRGTSGAAAGGTLRVLEHARSDLPRVARLQASLAPAWARMAGGCRLDHDVLAALGSGGFQVIERRSQGSGLLVEVVATAA